MRDVKSNRRRRVRLIKTIEERAEQQFHSAASALTIASDTEAAKLDIDAIRRILLVECQVKSSTSLRVEHPGAPAMDVVLDRPFLLVGSDPSCDLRLDHEEIKPRHCYFQWIEGRLFCCDVGQRTTFFPGRDSESNGHWIDHQPIPIGPFQLTLVDRESPLNVSASAGQETSEKVSSVPDFSPLERSPRLATEYPLLALQFEGVAQNDNVWPINRMLTMIGRGPQCKLRLNHKSMAYVQACLLRTPNGCWLIDIAKNGTTCVNDRAIQIAPLDIGDALQLGIFQVEVVTIPSPPASATVPSRKSKAAAAAARKK